MKLLVNLDGYRTEFDTHCLKNYEAVIQSAEQVEVTILQGNGPFGFNLQGQIRDVGSSSSSVRVRPTALRGLGFITAKTADEEYTIELVITPDGHIGQLIL